jgi:hypothetical protein
MKRKKERKEKERNEIVGGGLDYALDLVPSILLSANGLSLLKIKENKEKKRSSFFDNSKVGPILSRE